MTFGHLWDTRVYMFTKSSIYNLVYTFNYFSVHNCVYIEHTLSERRIIIKKLPFRRRPLFWNSILAKIPIISQTNLHFHPQRGIPSYVGGPCLLQARASIAMRWPTNNSETFRQRPCVSPDCTSSPASPLPTQSDR